MRPLAELRLRHPFVLPRRWHGGVALEAAVAVVLRGRHAADAEVLLVRRAARVGDPWSGDMAMPGGRRHADDRDLRATAVRETVEEVGLSLDVASVCLGRLPEVVTLAPSGGFQLRPMLVSPWVFVWTADVVPEVVSSREVTKARWVPLTVLRDPRNRATRPWRRLGVTWPAPAWRTDEDLVWGLTRAMLRRLFAALDEAAGD